MKIEIDLKEVKGMEGVGWSIADFMIDVNEGKGEIRQQIGGKTIFEMFDKKRYLLDLKEVFKKLLKETHEDSKQQ